MTRHTPLWSLVQVTGFCWEWIGPTQRGYGRRSGQGAYRVIYERLVGPVPRGLELDHLCRNTICVNPDHMEPVTRTENMRRRARYQTHCVHGHEYTPANTYLTPRGHRACRKCHTIAQQTARKARS